MVNVVASGANDGRHFRAMQTAGTQHLVDRTYREGGAFQWARETVKNAIEADATRIEFTIEWQAVENYGIYRRAIIDNGRGMGSDEIVQFFNTYGGGGKPIGGAHENFGVGAKTSLLPWNHYGIVVVSRSAGMDSMIWLYRDPESGEYGLRLFDVEDEERRTLWEPVVQPYDGTDEDGVDWRSVLPGWVGESGTAIVLMGNSSDTDTVLGDPNRKPEESTHGLAQYLNRRLWKLPSEFEISVDSLPVQADRKNWPKSRSEYTTKVTSARTRRVRGAEALILDPGNANGSLSASGEVPCQDGTKIAWFLWDGDRPDRTNHAFTDGFIAAEYDSELFDYTTHAAHYRQFGIADESVRKRVWLIVRPPRIAHGGTASFGVYPNSSRNQLLIQGGSKAGDPLPMADWGAEFADNMPEPIMHAIREIRSGMQGSIDDDAWRERLAERFGSRWRVVKYRANPNGQSPMSSATPGTSPKRRPVKKPIRRDRPGGVGATAGDQNTGTSGGTERGDKKLVAGGLPSYRWVQSNDVGPGMLATWMPNDPDRPEGVVLLNETHPVIQDQIAHWQSQYAPHHAEDVRAEVKKVYGEVAVAKVAHSEHLRGLMPDAAVVDDHLRSDAALTMSLLGLVAEESMIATRVGGKIGQRRRVPTQAQ